VPIIDINNRDLGISNVTIQLPITRDEAWELLFNFFENTLEEGNDVQERALNKFERSYKDTVRVFEYDGER
jgi:hypothetical protein